MTTAFDTSAFVDQLTNLAKSKGYSNGSCSREIALELDKEDQLSNLRKQYTIPLMKDVVPEGDQFQEGEESLYMCGNSLGPLPLRSKLYVEQELEVWSKKAVLGHWDHIYKRPWTRCEERVSILMSDIIGAKPNEVIAMGTLSSNLHIMLSTFYRPFALPSLLVEEGGKDKQSTLTPRHKIIYEALAFPSDQYALTSAITLAGFDPKTSLIALQGKGKERILQTEDILQVIERESQTGELAMILLGDVQYQTGQMFDIQKITQFARSKGIIVGWDLAHAFANVPLAMHDWDADFAVWCTYKYGSSGPGGMAGLFVNERWGKIGFQTCIGRDAAKLQEHKPRAKGLPRPAAWWGQKKSTRFSMPDSFDAMEGASGWQQSNPSALDMASLLGSLETMALAPSMLDNKMKEIDLGSHEYAENIENSTNQRGFGYIMPALRQKSQRLTAYLEHLLLVPGFLPEEANISIITPREARFRGSQLSVVIPNRESSKMERNKEENKSNGDKSDVPPPIDSTSFVSRVHHSIETKYGVVCDIRAPDILRFGPVAQYSTFEDVWRTADVLRKAIIEEM